MDGGGQGRARDERLVDAVIDGPFGACVLHALEHIDEAAGDDLVPPTDHSVHEAAARVRSLSWVQLHRLFLETAVDVNPWCGDAAPISARVALAPRRRPIAEALVEAHGPRLTAGVDRDDQELWLFSRHSLFDDLSDVYECGEFPWQGLRTWARIPDELRDAHAWAQDGPTECSRWSLSADSEAPVFEINLPEDWTALVRRYPSRSELFRWHEPGRLAPGTGSWTCSHNAWDIRIPPGQGGPPGGDGEPPALAIQLIDGAEVVARGIVMPDWAAVARDWAGVHVSWAGILTAEGKVQLLDHSWPTVLRYWFTEQTCWLRDVFVSAEPLPSAGIGVSSEDVGSDAERQEADRRHLADHLRAGPRVVQLPGDC